MKSEQYKTAVEFLKKGLPPEDEGGLFGAKFSEQDSDLIILSMKWDRTASYGKGARNAPDAIVEASYQLDLFDYDFGETFKLGSVMKPLSNPYFDRELRSQSEVNEASTSINKTLRDEAKRLLDLGKTVAVFGGDHSCPFGLIDALSEKYRDFGILHFDAHHDLRLAYEGFEHSHASIMRNAIDKTPGVSKLVSVGIRDFSFEEYDFAKNHEKISTYYDVEIYRAGVEGKISELIDKSIRELPQNIYISFDIDGLDPVLCPGTGTPVPGGLSFNLATLWLKKLVDSGRKIIGFDLCEVAPQPHDEEWNANVGARVLYKLAGTVYKSRYEG